MRYEQKDNKIIIYLVGSLSSNNVEEVSDGINSILKGKGRKPVVLNFNDLDYISSAGLRGILKLKQKIDALSIEGASLEVYDTLQMTGFTDIIPVKKALRKIDISKAEVIGSGFFSTVYRLDKDTIIKVFNRTSDPDQIERELKLSKEAFILGIPTAISFDIVDVGGGKLGVIFELLNSISLKSVLQEQKKDAEKYIKQYALLVKKINSIKCDNPIIPDMKKFYLRKIDTIKFLLDKKYYQKAKKMLEEVEDRNTFIHGDCHFKNIMIQDGEFLLIDMDTLSVGHPIFELAGLYAPYYAFDEDEPGNTQSFFGISAEEAHHIYNELLKVYFGREDKEIFEKIALVGYIHMVWWTCVNQPDNKVRLEGCKERLYKLLDKYNDLKI